MVFEWKKYCDVGKHLKNYSSEEEYQRSSISRYYYACFNSVKRYFEQEYYFLGRKNVHNNLINGLKGKSVEEDLLSESLNNLRRYRNNADYDEKFQWNNIRKTKKTILDIFMILDRIQELYSSF